ncbi:hypothetical protein ABGB18_34905 [Nonomuraea sp. B12E4]|uniref:hypothetical protein n=1 Tax=Nonomuraea sp. B12E4 TaxID=3153564 RepID=UPI00325EDAE8
MPNIPVPSNSTFTVAILATLAIVLTFAGATASDVTQIITAIVAVCIMRSNTGQSAIT